MKHAILITAYKDLDQLELLINEFASIEELISSSKNIEKKFYFLDDVIDNAKDILMLEDEIILGTYDNKKLNINYCKKLRYYNTKGKLYF